MAAAWAEQREIRHVIVFLQSHGVSAGYAVKVYRQYGAEAGLLHVLGEFSDEGHVYTPRNTLVASAEDILGIEPAVIGQAIDEHLVVEPRIGEGASPAVYLKSLHTARTGVAAMLKALRAVPPKPVRVEVEKAVAWFGGRPGLSLAPEQREAVRQAVAAKELVITGGPDTGKTTLVNGILSILEKKGRRILLAAPTGRAAKRMSDATGRPAETLHRLLDFSPQTRAFQRDRSRPLDADLLVVDECCEALLLMES